MKKSPPFPAGSVVVRVPRGAFPAPFSTNSDYDESDALYQRVQNYNLVIVPSGEVTSQIRSSNVLTYCFLWSGKSGKVYRWVDYYRGEWSRRSTFVTQEKVFVECVPPKNHHNAPRAVNVYASTAGVVWLALRATLPDLLWPMMGSNFDPVLSLDDAPFSTYFDRLEESPYWGGYTDDFRSKLTARLRLLFGLTEE